jgi:hypothetical protein
MTDTLERFAEIAYAALCEVGHADIIVPAFEHNGEPYLQFDTDDFPEDSDEFRCLVRAEQIALAAILATKSQTTNTPKGVTQ